ncbi:hypothetical protein [Streptomyces sp. NPDC058657]|uniref:hypothetical protein n=1 Tax=unclassified Streptomyces TaxID=2593676 RepID=UPI00364AE186
MSAWAVGTRIAAVRDATDTTVYLYGRGVYAGDFPRPGSGNWSEEIRQSARNVIEAELRATDTEQLRASDDAWMVRTIAETVTAGKRTQEEADRDLAEYRKVRAERDAHRAATPLEEQVDELLNAMDLNPRLDLDGGGVVWGYECWWMPEAKFDAMYGEHTVVEVPEPVRSDR